MWKWLERAWNAFSAGQGVYGVVTWAFPSVGGIVAVISAYASHLPWYLILFWGSGVFCFLVLASRSLFESYSKATIFTKVRTRTVNLASVVIRPEQTEELGIGLNTIVRNDSDQPIYFHMKRMDVSIDGRVNEKATLRSTPTLVQPRDGQEVTLAGISKLPKKENYTGKVEFNIAYGRKADRLNYEFTFTAVLEINLILNGRDVTARVVSRPTDMVHARV